MRSLWRLFAAGTAALGVAYFAAGAGTSLQAVIYQASGTAALVAIVVGVLYFRPVRRGPWLLLGGGLLLWVVGDAYWDAYRWILHAQAPFPSFADAAYICGYPLLIAGALALNRESARPKISDVLDLSIIAAVGAILCWSFIVEPVLQTQGLSTGATVVSVATPVADFVLMLTLIQICLRGRMKNGALGYLLVGFAGLLFSDLAYAYLNLRGTYTSGMWIDAGWLACYALWGIGALHPSMADIRLPSREVTAGSSYRRIGLLAASILVPPVALVIDEAMAGPLNPLVIGIGAIVITALVGIRVALLQRDRNHIQAALTEGEQRYRELFEEADRARATLATQNDQLREVDRLKDDLVALVSHELRTPLTSILGYVELLTDDPSPLTDDQRSFLTVVTRNAERLVALVNDLLFVAQVQAGRFSLDTKPLDIRSLVDEALIGARPRAAEGDVELTLRTDGEAEINGDASRLSQVIENLLSNAIKFTPRGGSVEVSVVSSPEAVVISVADTGIGISDDEQQQLFTRFFRSTNAVSNSIQGTGLGLSIVKTIVEAHHGQITFESREGKGSTFRISLPRLPGELALPHAA